MSTVSLGRSYLDTKIIWHFKHAVKVNLNGVIVVKVYELVQQRTAAATTMTMMMTIIDDDDHVHDDNNDYNNNDRSESDLRSCEVT